MQQTESLKKRKDFKTVYNKGKSLANKYLVMYIYCNGDTINRLGISVSKKSWKQRRKAQDYKVGKRKLSTK